MRVRLDKLLVDRGLVSSREKAQRLILAAAVRVDGVPARKPSDQVAPSSTVAIDAPERFVSRGGHKLEAALVAWAVDCQNKVAADLGASTGGFTDCLLQHGAARVHAVDVGKGQLAWRLRQDPRVIVHDKINARTLTTTVLGETVDMVTIDVSFISLTKVLPAAVEVLRVGGHLVALIKPQFEAGRKYVTKGGVVRDPQVQQEVQERIRQFGEEALGLGCLGTIESPLRGPAGNREFLIGFRKP